MCNKVTKIKMKNVLLLMTHPFISDSDSESDESELDKSEP